MAPLTRARLPFREKTEVYLLTPDGRVVAQDRGRYVMFPGGGVDLGEKSLGRSAAREVLEEVGITVAGPLTKLVTVDWVWFPEWADNPTRQERYRQFQGERVHILVGRAGPAQAGGQEVDAWKGRKTMAVATCLRLVQEYGARDHLNTRPYRVAQEMALQYLALMRRVPR